MRVCFIGGGVSSRFTFQNSERILVSLVYFVKQIVILNIVFGFCVFNSLWEPRLNVFLNICSKMSKTDPRSVNEFRTDHLCLRLSGVLVVVVDLFLDLFSIPVDVSRWILKRGEVPPCGFRCGFVVYFISIDFQILSIDFPTENPLRNPR